MDDAKYDEFIRHRLKVDRVGKASYARAAYLALDTRVRKGGLDDVGEYGVHFRREGTAKPRALFLVPGTGVEQLCLRLRAEDKTRCHAPRRSL